MKNVGRFRTVVYVTAVLSVHFVISYLALKFCTAQINAVIAF